MSVEKLERPTRLDDDRIAALRELFPAAFSEGRVNLEALRDELADHLDEVEPGDEHYGLSWPGKRAAKRLAAMAPSGTLAPAPGEGVDEASTQNLIIEGDNLEVLRILQKAYAGRVKLIYIDPPYNTGNDFVYKDDFKEPVEKYLEASGQADMAGLLTSNPKSSGRYHSAWLNFIYTRLSVARNLLRDDGIIFISIDDNEVANLRHVLDEIFGEENRVAEIVWQKKTGAGAKSQGFITLHEYILCYTKLKNPDFDISAPMSEKTRAMYNKKDEYFETLGPYATWPLDTTSMDERANLRFPIYHQEEEIWPAKQWLWSRERVEKAQRENKLVFNRIEKEGRWSVRFKGYLFSEDGEEKSGKPTSLFIGPYTQQGTKDIEQYFSREVFPFPKPVDLIKQILLIRTTTQTLEEELILDFFGGSGTTAESVMRANKEDGIARKFILVQLPETIHKGEFTSIVEITKERVRKASKKLKAEGATGDLGFRVLKLAKSNVVRWRGDKATSESLDDLIAQMQSTLVPGWKTEDVLTELMLLEGYPLDSSKTQSPDFDSNLVYSVTHPDKQTRLLVCLDDRLVEATIEQLTSLSDLERKTFDFICLDAALTDQLKARLADKVRVKTI